MAKQTMRVTLAAPAGPATPGGQICNMCKNVQYAFEAGLSEEQTVSMGLRQKVKVRCLYKRLHQGKLTAAKQLGESIYSRFAV